MPRIFSIDDLIVDDSFIHYCTNSNTTDTENWENYLLQHPGEAATVAEAKNFVLGLKAMLRAREKQQSVQHLIESLRAKQNTIFPPSQEAHQTIQVNPHLGNKRQTRLWFAAASVAIITLVAAWVINGHKEPKKELAKVPTKTSDSTRTITVSNNQLVKTGAGENRVFHLADGTKVTMNANTIFSVDSSFGNTERLVHLEGEAFFDVTHDASLPFIVRLNGFDIKVLGTMFNVKSFAGEKTSEATLVKGKVEIRLKNKPGKTLFLKPNEKVVLYNSGQEELSPAKRSSAEDGISSVIIKPLSISADGSSITETAWMRNRLEINDETFTELKGKLERKYGVRIRFSDEIVKQYKFTALFENESIDQVLKAMQLSYSFTYSKENNEIIISK